MNSDSDLGPQGEMSGGAGGSEPVLLARVYDPMEAQIIVAKLRGSGIEAFVRHDALSVVYGLTVDGCGQQDILVRAEDFEQAQTALEVTDEPGGTE